MLTIEQGVEMGRPSFIPLGLEVEGGALAVARRSAVGVVIVAKGTLDM